MPEDCSSLLPCPPLLSPRSSSATSSSAAAEDAPAPGGVGTGAKILGIGGRRSGRGAGGNGAGVVGAIIGGSGRGGSPLCCCCCPPRSLSTLAAMLRNRLFVLFLLLLVFFSSLFLLTSNGPQRARFHSLVAETHHQIVDNLKRNFEEEEPEKEPLEEVDDKYLAELGLATSGAVVVAAAASSGGEKPAVTVKAAPPQFWPDSPWRKIGNASEPVILSAVQNGHAGEAVHFVRNAQLLLPNLTVILYDLGMGGHEVKLVEKYCNTSSCLLKTFEASKFPGHVRNSKYSAFRPVLIQHTLKDAGCVLWMDVDQRFTTEDLSPFLAEAQKSGVLTWPLEDKVRDETRKKKVVKNSIAS